MNLHLYSDHIAAVLLLACGLTVAAIQRVGPVFCSSLTRALYPLVMLAGSIGGLTSIYLFVAIFGWIGVLWWFLLGIAMSFLIRPLVAVADGLGTIALIVLMPVAFFLWAAI